MDQVSQGNLGTNNFVTILNENNRVVSVVLRLNEGISKLNSTVCFDGGDQIREAGLVA